MSREIVNIQVSFISMYLSVIVVWLLILWSRSGRWIVAHGRSLGSGLFMKNNVTGRKPSWRGLLEDALSGAWPRRCWGEQSIEARDSAHLDISWHGGVTYLDVQRQWSSTDCTSPSSQNCLPPTFDLCRSQAGVYFTQVDSSGPTKYVPRSVQVDLEAGVCNRVGLIEFSFYKRFWFLIASFGAARPAISSRYILH